MRKLLIPLTLVLCSLASAASPPLTITKSGYFLTIIDSTGAPVFQKIDNVTDLRPVSSVPVNPVPVDPVVPVDPPKPPVVLVDKALAASITEAAKAVADPASSQGVALVYSHVSDAYSDGLVSTTSLWNVLKVATDASLAKTSVAGKDWKPFRTKLSDIITDRKQKGTLSTKEQISVFLASVKLGLEQSAIGSSAIAFDQVVSIVKSTNEAIDANQ